MGDNQDSALPWIFCGLDHWYGPTVHVLSLQNQEKGEEREENNSRLIAPFMRFRIVAK